MSRPLQSFFGSNPNLRPLLNQTQQLRLWQSRYEEFAPASLARSSQVGQIDRGHLTLLANNSAVAAKLRQMVPELLREFQDRGCPINELWVRVQVVRHAPVRPRSSAPLGNKGRKEVKALAESLEESPLRTALEHLLKRSA
ncbi:MAG: DUF721 domain-containing protein [Nitrosomonadales bacterium]|nr:DUF721 domain-containing protein [Nitrosomonadales bacterium]